jgi:hypothetical protein
VGGSAQRRFRGARAIALAGSVVLVPGALAGAGLAVAASGPGPVQQVTLSLTYSCQLSAGGSASGGFDSRVIVQATFPTTVTAGQQIQPAAVQITATLPQAAVAKLRSFGAATVAGSGALRVSESDQGAPVIATWTAQAARAVSLPQSGGLVLAEPGAAAASAASKEGTATFTAGALTMDLRLTQADSSVTTPATALAHCTPPAVAGRLAAVTVRAASPSASPSGSRSPAGHKSRIPPGCGKIRVRGSGIAVCGYITGYSDVAKAYGAALLQPKRPAKPGLVNLDFAERHVFKKGKLVVYSTGELYYHGRHELPPITATFLGFKFVPVTATLRLIELTPIKVVSVSGITAPPYPLTVHATTMISIRVFNVTVNGVPLNVGPGCRTATPVPLTLVGKGFNTLPPKGYTVPTGGPLSGMLTIPRFTGCGTSENLDPLFTGSISGPGNFVKMTQGKLCGPSQPVNWTCPPPVPKPVR